jgi:hypothetical protein
VRNCNLHAAESLDGNSADILKFRIHLSKFGTPQLLNSAPHQLKINNSAFEYLRGILGFVRISLDLVQNHHCINTMYTGMVKMGEFPPHLSFDHSAKHMTLVTSSENNQVRSIADVTKAVAGGGLTKKMEFDV